MPSSGDLPDLPDLDLPGSGISPALALAPPGKSVSLRVFLKDSHREGLPWRSSGSDSGLPMKGAGFHPWLGIQIPHAATKIWCSQRNKETEK